jgi:hypothetical protein
MREKEKRVVIREREKEKSVMRDRERMTKE